MNFNANIGDTTDWGRHCHENLTEIYSPTIMTRIVFKKDNQRCRAIHEIKKKASLIFALPPPPWLFLGGWWYICKV